MQANDGHYRTKRSRSRPRQANTLLDLESMMISTTTALRIFRKHQGSPHDWDRAGRMPSRSSIHKATSILCLTTSDDNQNQLWVQLTAIKASEKGVITLQRMSYSDTLT
jgi:hypothetical protein